MSNYRSPCSFCGVDCSSYLTTCNKCERDMEKEENALVKSINRKDKEIAILRSTLTSMAKLEYSDNLVALAAIDKTEASYIKKARQALMKADKASGKKTKAQNQETQCLNRTEEEK